ncbi:MAG: glycosyltransferase family 2 protein [Armatimonadota bacterium]
MTPANQQQQVRLSVAIPVYNEEGNLRALHAELRGTLASLPYASEIVFVDDGSTDATGDILRELCDEDPDVTVIRFRRNFGQTAAIAAGFEHARGDVVVAMDADLQNDPADIPRLVEMIEKGYDVVSGWRRDRKDPWLSRRLPSKIANWTISRVTNVRLHDYGCTLKAYTRDVVRNLRLYGEMHRFIPALASWSGARIGEIVVNHRRRRFGRSKYGMGRTLRVLLDLATVKFLLTYSTRPLHIFGLWGVLAGAAGFLIAAYLSVEKFVKHVDIGSRPLLLLAILLMFGGLQLVTMGLLAELQARTYHEAQGKPIYAVREIIRGGRRRSQEESAQ